MMVRTFGMVSAAILSVALAMIDVGSQPVEASCVVSQPLPAVLATAPTIFVGKVVSTSNLHRTAIVRVQEVWRGKHVSSRVVVLGSYVSGHAATSVDRQFRKGIRYLFVPAPTKRTAPFQDNVCTATQPYTAALARYRPAGAHQP